MTASLALSTWATGQATSPTLLVRVVAEVAVSGHNGADSTVKLKPSERVVPGDEVLYTLEIRNTDSVDAVAPTVTRAIPAHMSYVADSATGPGADVTYSADGGITFARPERLRTTAPDGTSQLVKPRDYTHIRWNFRNTLKSKSVAYARFRAVVK